MLKKRIIPCLDIQNGRTVKGVNFGGIRDAGNPLELAKRYAEDGADELVFLDITATIENRETLLSLVKDIACEIDIPFTVGGGVKSQYDVEQILKAGADKVSINSAAVQRPELINELSGLFGSQCIVVAVDTKYVDGVWKVFVHGGRTDTGMKTLQWVREIEHRGGGEVLLTSMNNDGVKNGFALDITHKVSQEVNIPIIASGGAGNMSDFKTLFSQTAATGGLAASIFHYGEITIADLKTYLNEVEVPIRL